MAPALATFFPDGLPMRFEFWDGSSLGPDRGLGTARVVSPDALRRILDRGAGSGPGDVVLVGSVEQIVSRLERWQELGVTDVIAAPFPVGDDRDGSLKRTREGLAEIAARLQDS